MSSTKPNPLPLNQTLRDLAVLRASDVNLSSLLPAEAKSPAGAPDDPVEESARRSYAFVKEARGTVRLHDKGEVDVQGRRVEGLREEMEDVLSGLEGGQS